MTVWLAPPLKVIDPPHQGPLKVIYSPDKGPLENFQNQIYMGKILNLYLNDRERKLNFTFTPKLNYVEMNGFKRILGYLELYFTIQDIGVYSSILMILGFKIFVFTTHNPNLVRFGS